jgi:hypothetical protein
LVAAANVGLSVPELSAKPSSVEVVEILITVTVYVDVVAPSCAVTATVMLLLPTVSGIEAVPAPEATGVPFTLTVAVASLTVGVTVTSAMALGTLAV